MATRLRCSGIHTPFTDRYAIVFIGDVHGGRMSYADPFKRKSQIEGSDDRGVAVPGVGVRPRAGPGKEAESGVAVRGGGPGDPPAGSAARQGLVPRGVGPSSFWPCSSTRPIAEGRLTQHIAGGAWSRGCIAKGCPVALDPPGADRLASPGCKPASRSKMKRRKAFHLPPQREMRDFTAPAFMRNGYRRRPITRRTRRAQLWLNMLPADCPVK